MTAPFSRDDPGRDRSRVARAWAYQISHNSYIPLPSAKLETELLGMVNQLFDTVLTEPFDPEAAFGIGDRLVGMNCVGRPSFQRTMEVLGKALLNQRELHGVRGLPTKVVRLLGAVAAGYADAMRQHTLAQQESLNRTIIAIGRDARAGLHTVDDRFAAVLDNSPTGIAVTTADGLFLRTNDALGRLFGYSPSEFAGLTVFDLLPPEDEPFVRTACAELVAGRRERLRQRRDMVTKSGETVPVTLIGSALAERGESRLVLVVQDDTELRLLQNQLTRQSLHDVVTGLPNRQFCTTRLESVLHQLGPGRSVTVYHLDLDAFAVIADGLGRIGGDRLLKITADRLKAVVAAEDAMVARLDGDEFAIVLRNSPSTPDVATVVERINQALAEPVHVDGQDVTVTAGIGVVHRPRPDADPVELLRASDVALRRAKQQGRRQWALYDAEDDHRDRADFELLSTMPAAWHAGDVQVHYRPRVALADGRPDALEPRLRWHHRRFGPIGHRACVRLAERSGLQPALGDWLLHLAGAQAPRRHPFGSELPLLVELSPAQAADPDLVGRVLRVLADDGLPPDRLRLGMPADVLRDRPEPAENLRVLADEGIGMALHGFTGSVTELAHVVDLPITGVRVAEDLVGPPPSGPVATALTDLVATVHDTGRAVEVADVDTPEQATWWRTAGADTALGRQFTTW